MPTFFIVITLQHRRPPNTWFWTTRADLRPLNYDLLAHCFKWTVMVRYCQHDNASTDEYSSEEDVLQPCVGLRAVE